MAIPVADRRSAPAEILLAIIEGRLAAERPSDALGITDEASLADACEEYSRVLNELARFREHPVYAPRAAQAERRLRGQLIAFSRRRITL